MKRPFLIDFLIFLLSAFVHFLSLLFGAVHLVEANQKRPEVRPNRRSNAREESNLGRKKLIPLFL